jgi:hypothetical protein
MRSKLAISVWTILTGAACAVATAAPLTTGGGGSISLSGNGESQPSSHAFPGTRSLPEFTGKNDFINRSTALGVGAAASDGSILLGSTDNGVPRTTPLTPLSSVTDAVDQSPAVGIPVGDRAGEAPAAAPDRRRGDTAVGEHQLLNPLPSVNSLDRAATWDTHAPGEYGILDTPEFAATVALLGGLFVIFLVTRGLNARRTLTIDNAD